MQLIWAILKICHIILYYIIPNTRNLSSLESQSNLLPPINLNIVSMGKLNGHTKRRYHDQVCVFTSTNTPVYAHGTTYIFIHCYFFAQAVSKLIPLLQSFSSKQPLEVLVVDLKTGPLSLLAAEANVRDTVHLCFQN